MKKVKDSISLEKYVKQRFTDADKAIQAALISQEKAINKADTAAEKRFDLLNELRSGVATKDQIQALEKVVCTQDSTNKARHDALAKLVYIGIGILAALQFAAGFLIK